MWGYIQDWCHSSVVIIYVTVSQKGWNWLGILLPILLWKQKRKHFVSIPEVDGDGGGWWWGDVVCKCDDDSTVDVGDLFSHSTCSLLYS